MLKGTLATLLGAACALSITSAGAHNTSATVSESLSVESVAGRVLVHVTVDNRGPDTIYVPRSIATEKDLFSALFEIRESATGELIDYIGPMVKRGPLTENDFLPIKPRTTHSNTLDITDSYAFRQGQHTYQLTYVGQYLGDVRGLAEIAPLKFAPVPFTHTRK